MDKGPERVLRGLSGEEASPKGGTGETAGLGRGRVKMGQKPPFFESEGGGSAGSTAPLPKNGFSGHFRAKHPHGRGEDPWAVPRALRLQVSKRISGQSLVSRDARGLWPFPRRRLFSLLPGMEKISVEGEEPGRGLFAFVFLGSKTDPLLKRGVCLRPLLSIS